jgi:transcriptional regulator with XRE-family HTH domain
MEDAQLEDALAALGTRVRSLRETAGLSQAAAAIKAGISQSNWSKVERGAIDPSIGLVLKIQMALSAPSIESLFGAFPTASLSEGIGRG